MIRNLLYGFIIGLGFIIPGVSGSVLATIMGIYEEIIERCNHFLQKPKENFCYLMPLVIGILISIFLFSNIILYLLQNKLFFISYVFIGLILGCIPYLIKEIKKKTEKKIALLPFFLTLFFGLFLFFLEKNIISIITKPTPSKMFLAGIIYAIGKIIPGISGASLLMLLGVYHYFLEIIAHPFHYLSFSLFKTFLPFLISFGLSAIIILKLMAYFLTNHFRYTYSAIIGFVISSILFIYPGSFNIQSLIITILSFIISYYLC